MVHMRIVIYRDKSGILLDVEIGGLEFCDQCLDQYAAKNEAARG